jgi:hypothetical protein
MALVLVVPMILLSTNLLGQDPPKDKVKGSLPKGWSKLGLSDDQKQKIYAIEADYKTKIDELNKQLAELKKEEQTKMTDVLTDDQKKRLKELLLKTLPDDPKPEEKKPADKKPEEKKPN